MGWILNFLRGFLISIFTWVFWVFFMTFPRGSFWTDVLMFPLGYFPEFPLGIFFWFSTRVFFTIISRGSFWIAVLMFLLGYFFLIFYSSISDDFSLGYYSTIFLLGSFEYWNLSLKEKYQMNLPPVRPHSLISIPTSVFPLSFTEQKKSINSSFISH